MECGLSVGEASSIIAEAVAAGVATVAYRRSPGALRTEKWRVNNRHKTSQCDAQANEPETVTNRHKPSQSVTSDNTPLSSSKEDNRKRGARLPQSWSPSEIDRTFAKQLGWSDAQIDSEADNFRDYWIARPGSGGTKLDWPATWRKWARSSKTKPANPVAGPQPASGPVDWDTVCRLWKKNRFWSKHAPGSDPDSPACQCPPEILVKHGIPLVSHDPPQQIPRLRIMG